MHRKKASCGDRHGLMRSLLVAVGATALFAVSCAPEPVPSPSPALADPVIYAEQIVAATNDVRREEGLEELQAAPCATEVALDRAADRVAAGDLEHAPLDDVFDACDGYSASAENLVNSQATPVEVVDAWMASPGHRANVLDPDLTGISVGCVTSDAGMLCSQIFVGAE